MPHVRPLGKKLWELRSFGPRAQHRVLYVAVSGQRLLLLNAFTKKTQKTPAREITLATNRYADWLTRQTP